MFCDKCYIRIDKCVFIIVKIKCVNSDRICDICDKVNFIFSEKKKKKKLILL